APVEVAADLGIVPPRLVERVETAARRLGRLVGRAIVPERGLVRRAPRGLRDERRVGGDDDLGDEREAREGQLHLGLEALALWREPEEVEPETRELEVLAERRLVRRDRRPGGVTIPGFDGRT